MNPLKIADVCNKPILEQFEFPIQETNYSKIEPFYFENKNTTDLKENVICEFLHILDQLECGIQPNLEMILEEISLINIYG